ncbi:MAG: CxxC-x17-CxxC domain-containing protein [Patescibacteria group bacterium]
MGTFQRPGGGFNRGGFGGPRKFGGRDGGRPAMFRATCSECGDDCQLPFKPTGERPVFCSNCFAKQQGDDGGRPNRFESERRDRPERPRFEERQMHDAVCDKCGKDCQVPFRPMAGKPIFCEACFDRSASNVEKPQRNSGELMDQFKILNAKIDKLLKILAPSAVEEAVEKIEKIEKPEVVEEKKTKAKAKVATKKVAAKKKK